MSKKNLIKYQVYVPVQYKKTPYPARDSVFVCLIYVIMYVIPTKIPYMNDTYKIEIRLNLDILIFTKGPVKLKC